MKSQVLVTFGTRPEAIKLAPVIKALKNQNLDVKICVFRQHKETLDQMLREFGIKPDYDLPVSLSDKAVFSKEVPIYKKGINLLKSGFGLARFVLLLKKNRPGLMLVQGDTSTAMLTAFIATFMGISVGHVEAGLRTYDKRNPFPEEINRRIIGVVADIHFPPTETAKSNLLKEGVPESSIFVTGNTVIGAAKMVLGDVRADKDRWLNFFKDKFNTENKNMIIVTAHRRENFGEGMKNIMNGIKKIAEDSPETTIVYPVHPNPNVRTVAFSTLSEISNIKLLEPLDYHPFMFLMDRSRILLTDSGGIQEEASVLGKPVLVMRKVTERPEAVLGGNTKVIGTDEDSVSAEVLKLLRDEKEYARLAKTHKLFGDGLASERIAETVKSYLTSEK